MSKLLLIIILCLFPLISSCTTSPVYIEDNNGSASETVGVFGTVAYPNAAFASHAVVRLRSSTFIADNPSSTAVIDTVTNESGHFYFPPVAAGEYLLEALDSNGNAGTKLIQVTNSDSLYRTDSIVLNPAGTVTGKIDVPAELSIQPINIYVYGLQRKITVDTSGKFSLSLPCGEHTMLISAKTSYVDTLPIDISLAPSQILDLGSIELFFIYETGTSSRYNYLSPGDTLEFCKEDQFVKVESKLVEYFDLIDSLVWYLDTTTLSVQYKSDRQSFRAEVNIPANLLGSDSFHTVTMSIFFTGRATREYQWYIHYQGELWEASPSDSLIRSLFIVDTSDNGNYYCVDFSMTQSPTYINVAKYFNGQKDIYPDSFGNNDEMLYAALSVLDDTFNLKILLQYDYESPEYKMDLSSGKITLEEFEALQSQHPSLLDSVFDSFITKTKLLTDDHAQYQRKDSYEMAAEVILSVQAVKKLRSADFINKSEVFVKPPPRPHAITN